ncbi:MAG: glycosyltransferase [Clostridia bacterium]|nr:glycosyltransferase [Clostridia bacterium]
MISVVIAAYNGKQYITQQLQSVLCQLGADDEVIISDDFPEGNTYPEIEELLKADKRLVYVEGPRKGVIKNFENAIKHSKGDYIFLCDQDDVWLDGKVSAVMEEFNNGALVVMHDAFVTDDELNVTENSFFASNGCQRGILKNIIKNSYIGSCMAFSAKLKPYILPFPENLPMHDQWIGLVGEKTGRVSFINKQYNYYRRHEGAVTGGKTSFSQKVKWRISIIKAIMGKQVDLK